LSLIEIMLDQGIRRAILGGTAQNLLGIKS
jgi:hypothetical protein